jgi:hypothetical protein
VIPRTKDTGGASGWPQRPRLGGPDDLVGGPDSAWERLFSRLLHRGEVRGSIFALDIQRGRDAKLRSREVIWRQFPPLTAPRPGLRGPGRPRRGGARGRPRRALRPAWPRARLAFGARLLHQHVLNHRYGRVHLCARADGGRHSLTLRPLAWLGLPLSSSETGTFLSGTSLGSQPPPTAAARATRALHAGLLTLGDSEAAALLAQGAADSPC